MHFLYLIGHGICHQLPSRSFLLDGTSMPLCARCSGIYVGIAGGLGYIAARGRLRAGGFVSVPILVFFILLLSLMGLDVLTGTNFLGGLLAFRDSNLASRLITGLLTGIAVPVLVMPAFNFLWRDHPESSLAPLAGWKDTGGILLVAAVLFVLTYYPLFLPIHIALSLISICMLLGVYTLLNATIFRTVVMAFPSLNSILPRPLLLTVGFFMGAFEIGMASYTRFKLGI